MKIRRPEIVRLAEQLRSKHPDWSEDRLMVEAKVIATSPRLVAATANGQNRVISGAQIGLAE